MAFSDKNSLTKADLERMRSQLIDNQSAIFDTAVMSGLTKRRLEDTFCDIPFRTIVSNRVVPAKRHSKSVNGGKRSYHRRIQKKWNKRYGLKPFNGVYMINTEVLRVPFYGF